MDKIDAPLNANERYLYGINMRLDVVIKQLSSLIDAYAHQNKMATTNETTTFKEIPKATKEVKVSETKKPAVDKVVKTDEVKKATKPAKRTRTKK